eukprot:scaffold340501_cov27-Prasinocladus_malaysianus.AAC.1
MMDPEGRDGRPARRAGARKGGFSSREVSGHEPSVSVRQGIRQRLPRLDCQGHPGPRVGRKPLSVRSGGCLGYPAPEELIRPGCTFPLFCSMKAQTKRKKLQLIIARRATKLRLLNAFAARRGYWLYDQADAGQMLRAQPNAQHDMALSLAFLSQTYRQNAMECKSPVLPKVPHWGRAKAKEAGTGTANRIHAFWVEKLLHEASMSNEAAYDPTAVEENPKIDSSDGQRGTHQERPAVWQ